MENAKETTTSPLPYDGVCPAVAWLYDSKNFGKTVSLCRLAYADSELYTEIPLADALAAARAIHEQRVQNKALSAANAALHRNEKTLSALAKILHLPSGGLYEKMVPLAEQLAQREAAFSAALQRAQSVTTAYLRPDSPKGALASMQDLLTILDDRALVELQRGTWQDDEPFSAGRAVPAPPAVVEEPELHLDDKAVNAFAAEMRDRLALKRAAGYGGWQEATPAATSRCLAGLRRALDKGDMVNVANYAMMLHAKGWQDRPVVAADDKDAARWPEAWAKAIRDPDHSMSQPEFLSASTQVGGEAADVLAALCHRLAADAGWWQVQHTLDGPKVDVRESSIAFKTLWGATKIGLIMSEGAEALEGWRKNKADEHLPQFSSTVVELADVIIRCCDLAGGLGMPLGAALAAKLRYNAERADHKPEVRAATGGKAF